MAVMERWLCRQDEVSGTPDLVATLIRREATPLERDGVAFEFRRSVESRSEHGLMLQVRLSVREVGDRNGDAIVEEVVVRPVLPAASVDELGPWERTALRQGARRVLLRAALRADARAR
jgi:hypothetical protein